MTYMEKIKQFRQARKITQQNIANTLGITQQQWFKYEKEINELPIRYLEIICSEYRISADWILDLSDSMTLPEPQNSRTAVTFSAEVISREIAHLARKRQQEGTEGFYEVE